MNCRRYGSKPTIGFWVIIAFADLVVLTATIGPLAMFAIIALLAVFAGGVIAARMLRKPAEAPAKAVVRRRA
ncbi:hypothetical protein Ade02nite_49630 [Paractinoplanes deccanensis]|uniref:Uncharacterized protein n=1 Tax=Paractinoplanes deccanensis TaxID=113561 RepID=A0ABQ3Y8J0_9ACTN|nr:hypothetical protein [Actinoplanes deccanensis]GID76322.1 hypothetical protein Ade02nite_49630 [Actinoplanes deccanensis]